MKLFKIIASSVFLRQNAILFIGAAAVGLLNYLFYPVVGRLLDPTSFGEVQAIFSLFLQLTIFLTVLSITTVFVVANYKDKKQRNTTVLELERVSVWVALIIVVLTLIFGEWLKSYFKFASSAPFTILAILLVVSVPLTFRTAFLRGVNKFIPSAVANLVSAAGRFVFSLPLVLFGLGAEGALAGVAIGQAVAMLYSKRKSRLVGLTHPSGVNLWALPKIGKIRSEVKYSLVVLAGSLALMLQLTIDALVVKHLFDSYTAGLYAGVVTVARTIFFLTTPIVMALLPAVKIDAPPGNNRARLIKSLGLFMAISLPFLAAMVLFPTQVTTLLMGAKYAPVANLLPMLSVTTFLISLLNVVVSYFLALKRNISAMLAIIGLAATFGLIYFHHGSLQAIVESLFVGSMVSMSLIAVWVTRARLTSRGSIDETTSTIHRGPGAQ